MIPFVLSVLLWSPRACAHVTVDPKSALAGHYEKLVFRVPHGCDGSPTVRLTVRIPEGVVSVKPQVHPGWKITTKTAKYSKPIQLHGKEIQEGVVEVTWAGGPLPDAFMDEFGMSVKLPDLPGHKLAFPAIQKCRHGTNEWTEEKSEGHGDAGKGLPAQSLQLAPGE